MSTLSVLWAAAAPASAAEQTASLAQDSHLSISAFALRNLFQKWTSLANVKMQSLLHFPLVRADNDLVWHSLIHLVFF